MAPSKPKGARAPDMRSVATQSHVSWYGGCLAGFLFFNACLIVFASLASLGDVIFFLGSPSFRSAVSLGATLTLASIGAVTATLSGRYLFSVTVPRGHVCIKRRRRRGEGQVVLGEGTHTCIPWLDAFVVWDFPNVRGSSAPGGLWTLLSPVGDLSRTRRRRSGSGACARFWNGLLSLFCCCGYMCCCRPFYRRCRIDTSRKRTDNGVGGEPLQGGGHRRQDQTAPHSDALVEHPKLWESIFMPLEGNINLFKRRIGATNKGLVIGGLIDLSVEFCIDNIERIASSGLPSNFYTSLNRSLKERLQSDQNPFDVEELSSASVERGVRKALTLLFPGDSRDYDGISFRAVDFSVEWDKEALNVMQSFDADNLRKRMALRTDWTRVVDVIKDIVSVIEQRTDVDKADRMNMAIALYGVQK